MRWIVCIGVLAFSPIVHAQGNDPGAARWRPPGQQDPAPPPPEHANDGGDGLPPPEYADDDGGGLPPPEYADDGGDGLPPPEFAGDDDGNTLAPPTGSGAPAGGGTHPLRAQVRAGVGFGQHHFELPLAEGERVLPQANFAATELGFSLRYAGTSLRPGLRVDYRSSLGYAIREPRPAAAPRSTDARVHALSAAFELCVPFSDADDPSGFALDVGYHFEDLRAVSELQTAPYGLSGLLLRPALELALGERVSLGLAVPVTWLSVMDVPARQLGLRGGVLLAGELELAVRAQGALWLRIAYRESYARVIRHEGDADGALVDGRRFVTGGLELRY